MASSSSSHPHLTLEVKEEYSYPYPSHVYTPNFVSLKLSGRDEYCMWKTQMVCLLKSHDMFGFIDGTLISPRTNSNDDSETEKVGDNHYSHRHRLWVRSDALVKGWIMGSLSKEILGYVVNRLHQETTYDAIDDFSAKNVWDVLQAMYDPQLPVFESNMEVLQDQDGAYHRQRLYKYTLEGNCYGIRSILREEMVTLIDKITNNGNTALHIAVGNALKPSLLHELLDMTPKNTQLLDVRNSDGHTLLHVAAIIGNTEAADILVARNRDLLLAKDNEGQTPLSIALSNMHTQTTQLLLQKVYPDKEKRDTLFSGQSGDELLVTVISSKDFRLAYRMLILYFKTLHDIDTVMMAVAQNFPCEVGILEKYLVWPLFIEKAEIHAYAVEVLRSVCTKYPDHRCFTNSLFEATRLNAYEVVQYLVHFFPNLISSANKDGHNIIQYAVINRSEKIYNLLYQMSEHRNIYRTIKDSYGNNLLHLAARLAPSHKLNLISGAALQIQRELQWLKEVESFVCPLSIIEKNSFDKTPQMIFTTEHKDLVIDGEKWMKVTAESYTITAALIITMVFAAAITVPGGSNQDTGIPIFTKDTAFTIFAISDAISLFTAVTSLLMFLSILTARFAEQDFLFKLPTKLIIGLAMLFISTTAMIVAFGATLYLVFGQSNSRILIPIAMLTCLPVTSFVTLQFPLVVELTCATFGRSIFGKKREDRFY